jgi:phosphoenolpyruvate---glycerone phosphotransferase subunit DhaL
MGLLTCDRLRSMTEAAFAAVTERADEFSALDAVAGDGDHGTAIVAALSAIHRASGGDDLKKMLGDMAFAAMSEACGSTSTLVGALFLGMSDGANGPELDASATAAMFGAGLESVRKQTKAAVGDKTVMDALIPAVEAMQATSSTDVSTLLQAAAKAAALGAEGTKDMVARFGRAKNLGERSVGHADPGATSMACIFEAFAQGFSA